MDRDVLAEKKIALEAVKRARKALGFEIHPDRSSLKRNPRLDKTGSMD